MSARPSLVVLRALNLGDLLTAVPALRALADAFPTHHRVLVGPRVFAPLVIREGLADEVAESHELAAIDQRLAGPDVAVDLHGRGPESQPLLLALRPRRLIAFAHRDVTATVGMPAWQPGEHEVRRWCRLLHESGIAADPTRLKIRAPTVSVPAGLPGVTVIHPGAAAAARRWPLERFAAVARSELASGRRVVVTGSAAERPLACRLARSAGLRAADVLAGRTDLDQLTAVIATAARLVSGDTGVAHLAAALGTPTVTLFGPVPPSEWGPPQRPRHIALWAGARGDPHASTVDAGLLAIPADDVISSLACLDRRRAPGREAALR